MCVLSKKGVRKKIRADSAGKQADRQVVPAIHAWIQNFDGACKAKVSILLINTRFVRKHEQRSWQRANGRNSGVLQGFSKSSSSLKSSSDPASSIKSSSPPMDV